MAILKKTLVRNFEDAELKAVSLRFNRGDQSAALSVAAKLAWISEEPRYLYATHAGFQVVQVKPELPSGQEYWRITVAGNEITGELYES